MPDKAALLKKLDEIEAEMKKIGSWTENPPDLQSRVARGEIRTYLDAPSFELWLQTIFSPNARSAVSSGNFPKQSNVGVAAMRQYDYHSVVAEAEQVTKLLFDFDRMVVSTAK